MPEGGHVKCNMENSEETGKSHRQWVLGIYEDQQRWPTEVLRVRQVLQQSHFHSAEGRYAQSRASPPLFHQARLIMHFHHNAMPAIHHMAGAPPTLCTLPPECLLAIISYLPPTSYAPLVQTSHHFLAFFSAHAATICNTHIRTHYALSASYLQSTYLDGWLVPSHPAVAAQERLLLRPPVCRPFSHFTTISPLHNQPRPFPPFPFHKS